MSSGSEKSENVLLQLCELDTPTGVSSATMELLSKQTGLTQAEIIHLALRQFADRHLPRYELDDGPLTDAQHEAIRIASAANALPEAQFTQSLF